MFSLSIFLFLYNQIIKKKFCPKKQTYICRHEEMRVLMEVDQLMDQDNEKEVKVSEHDKMKLVDPYSCNIMYQTVQIIYMYEKSLPYSPFIASSTWCWWWRARSTSTRI